MVESIQHPSLRRDDVDFYEVPARRSHSAKNSRFRCMDPWTQSRRRRGEMDAVVAFPSNFASHGAGGVGHGGVSLVLYAASSTPF